MKEKERRKIILIKEIQTYSGLENFGDTYSLIHLGGCIYPVEETAFSFDTIEVFKNGYIEI